MLKFKLSHTLIKDIGLKFIKVRLDVLEMKKSIDNYSFESFYIDKDNTVYGFENYLEKLER